MRDSYRRHVPETRYRGCPYRDTAALCSTWRLSGSAAASVHSECWKSHLETIVAATIAGIAIFGRKSCFYHDPGTSQNSVFLLFPHTRAHAHSHTQEASDGTVGSSVAVFCLKNFTVGVNITRSFLDIRRDVAACSRGIIFVVDCPESYMSTLPLSRRESSHWGAELRAGYSPLTIKKAKYVIISY